MNSAIRLQAGGAWKEAAAGHASITGRVADLPSYIDYCSPTLMPDRRFDVNLSSTAPGGGVVHQPEDVIEIFTDGSKSDSGVGGGIYIARFERRMSFRLHNECSVVQAEIAAISRAANWMRYYRIYEIHILICIDSKAAINSLAGVYEIYMVNECQVSLNEIARHSSLELFWVPGHSGVSGNIVADELARSGARLQQGDIDGYITVPLNSCKQLVQRQVA